MGVDFHATAGPVIQRAADLVAMLSKLAPREVLFIDEIHRLPPAAEEYLYPAMEDYQIDLIIGQGPGARSIRYRLAPFTLIGATTRSGLITRRCGSVSAFRCVWCSTNRRSSGRLSAVRLGCSAWNYAPTALQRSRSGRGHPARRDPPAAPHPRLRRSQRLSSVDAPAADGALQRLDVDARGLDGMDRRYLRCIAENYAGGPVGSRRSRRRSVTSATSSKRSSSRTCSRRVSCSARRVAAR